ncbi:hypothetical protein ACRRTK_020489 [Alexandromys fortis]
MEEGSGRDLEATSSTLPKECVEGLSWQMNRPIQVKPADSESRGGSSCLRQPPSREGPLVSDPSPSPPFFPPCPAAATPYLFLFLLLFLRSEG